MIKSILKDLSFALYFIVIGYYTKQMYSGDIAAHVVVLCLVTGVIGFMIGSKNDYKSTTRSR